MNLQPATVDEVVERLKLSPELVGEQRCRRASDAEVDMASAAEIIEKARARRGPILTEMESKQLLSSLGIPTTEMKLADLRERRRWL